MKRWFYIPVILTLCLLSSCGGHPSDLPTQAPATTAAAATQTPSQASTPTAPATNTVTPSERPTGTPDPSEAQVRALCSDILTEYGATIDGIYAYINNTDPLTRLYYNSADMPQGAIPDEATLALHILTTGKGVCYHYSALTYYLLQEAGYEAILITGARRMDQAAHRWTMVKVDGDWYHFDPQHRQKLLKDSQKSSASYLMLDAMEWDRSQYPATP